MYRVFSCAVGRGCLLWPVDFLGRTLLVFALLHSVVQGQICLLLEVFLDFLRLHSSPLKWNGHLFGVLVLKGLIGLHRTVQLQLLQHYWLGHRLGLLWYRMVCLGNEQRSFCHFWDCIQVLMFKLVLEKGEEPEIKLPTSAGSWKRQETSRKTSISALLTMPKPLTVWITINCGKFWKRWEYQTTWSTSWEICMQDRKQQLELDMEQKTGSK